MSSSTLQFVVAGALIGAWAWMLGRPLLTNLLRRSRRDSVGHFRYQQAVLGQPLDHDPRPTRRWFGLPHPIVEWRAQPIERRRLQLLLAFGIATFLSLLFAIALRGWFVRLFALMAICFALYLATAVAIGMVKLRRQEAELAERIWRGSAEERVVSEQGHQVDPAAEVLAQPATADLYGEFGHGQFDEEFFEPIPELTFEPLNLDSSLLSPADPEPQTLFGSLFDDAGERRREDPLGWSGDPILEDDQGLAVEEWTEAWAPDGEAEAPAALADDVTIDGIADGTAARTDEPEVRFTTPPVERNRPPKGQKARPIYIESQLDEDDGRAWAVND